ncbi:MAG: fructokinase [Actinobacteria bacterium]|nr:fructokinase [Actinomycetota bacterium]
MAGEVLIDILPTGDVVGGGPANTARALARLGHGVDFIDGISSDRYGLIARKALGRDGVDLAHSLSSEKPTCTATVTLDSHGAASYEFLIDKTATFDFNSSWLPDPSMYKPSVMHIGTLATIIEPGASELFDWALRVGEFAPIIFDPNIRPSVLGDREIYSSSVEKWISISSIVKVSDEDIKWLYPDETMDEVAHRWIAQGVSCVVITRGAHGLIGFTEHGMEEVDGAKVTVIDTVGAGDTVGAIVVEGVIEYSVASLQGHVLNSVLHKAAIAAGITCSRAGAQPPYKHELTEAMENNAVY